MIHEDDGITQIPDNLSFSEAVAAMEGAHYAYNFIKRIQDLKGKSVLVNGATGAIGSAALQFLVYHGAIVTAVCRKKHDELIRSYGANEVIHYDKEDFTKTNQIYDVIFDAAGKSTFGQCKGILRQNGFYISSELGPKLQNPLLSLLTLFGTGQKVKFPIPTDVKKSKRYIMNRLADDSFKPMIDREYPFEDIRKAYKYVLGGQKVGNVVLKFED
ncbi:MAG: NAD(P)-dependent alcohol dehydrogenase [Gracilimonas sp.]|nr:NAD(P)-dependent alcohol dehydrogenase [Gracilimonas sp.]